MTDQLVAEDFSDGIHPNVVGYQKMANVWFHALTNMVPKPIAEPSAAAGSQGVLSFVSAVRDGSNESFSLGYKFSTGPKPLVVTALGYLNDGAVGANAIHSVGIYNDSTQQLVTPAVSVTTTGGDLTGSHCTFTYVNLPVPVILSPNTTYEIAGTDPGTGFVRSAAGVTFSNGIVPGSAVADFTVATTLAFPASTSLPNGAANIGPNFRTAE